jgi:hypothetical protein
MYLFSSRNSSLSMERNIYTQILAFLDDAPSIQKYRKRGLCHQWVGEALTILSKSDLTDKAPIELSAREVYMGFSMSHTFLRLLAEGQLPFLIDGTGVEDFPPYAGYESDAPEHLQNSRPDILNYYFRAK